MIKIQGTIYTIDLSESILAKAAMEHSCNGTSWPTSIDTFVRKLLDQGLVENWLKGELYARLMLIAHDWIRCRRGQSSDKADQGLCQRSNSGSEQKYSTSEPDFHPTFMKSFTLRAFLEVLYAENYHESIMKIDQKILGAG